TLLIWGSSDRFQPWDEVGVRLRELLPNPEVRLIERAGHFHMLERPEAFVTALLDGRHQEKE
ncbi:MAG: alpha/beta hydrolase, partial [Chloroflexi bacterium]|nr:alpha/beta hydrolase [Chloroflexota bacterium]